MRRFRGRFRAPKRFRRRGLSFKRQRLSYHNINIATRELAENTTESTQLIIPSDSPDHTIVGAFATPVQCENHSIIKKVDLTLEIVADGAPSPPFLVAFLVWKDAAHGGITTPTTAQDIIAVGSTTQLALLKKNTCQYEKFFFTIQGDRRRFKIRIPKRFRTLNQGEAISITVSNLAAATDDILYFIQGRIVTAA